MAEKVAEKTLYDYQEKDLNKIFEYLEEESDDFNLLYQLPTGGGKTVVFSEIIRRYIEQTNKKVVILTHRIELCKHPKPLSQYALVVLQCCLSPFPSQYLGFLL